MKGEMTVKRCREKNQTDQYGEKIWSLLLEVMNLNIESSKLLSAARRDPEHSLKLERCRLAAEKAKERFWKFVLSLFKTRGDPGPVGPVGEYPIHICFLLGLKELGMELVEKHYCTKHLINVGYQDDLKRYEDRLIGRKFFDRGLYTGETILHIAIVTCDADTVEFLLQRGASLYSRAIGVFFMPQWIPPPKNQSRFQRFKSKLFAFATSEINKYKNDYSQVCHPVSDSLAVDLHTIVDCCPPASAPTGNIRCPSPQA